MIERIPLPDPLIAMLPAVCFILGAVWGSFLNVCIYRLPCGKSIVLPGSHCTTCGSAIHWYDNIPVVSYFVLRGHCRACGAHFSMRYAAIELLTAALFVGVWWRYPMSPAVLAHWVVLCLLIVATFTDIDHFIIPDGITLGGLVFAVAVAPLLGHSGFVARDLNLIRESIGGQWLQSALSALRDERLELLVWSAFSAAFAWALLTGIAVFGRFLFHKEAMGGGDVKLFAFIGAYFGVTGTVGILFLSAVIGAIGGGVLLLWHHLIRHDEFDELTFAPARAVVPPYASSPGGVAQGLGEAPTATTALSEPRRMKVARITSRQLHHFPYGPYIAIAAGGFIFAFPRLTEYLRTYLDVW